MVLDILTQKAKGLLSTRVTCRVRNNSGLKLEVAAWPASDASGTYDLSAFRGSEWDGTVLPPGTMAEEQEASDHAGPSLVLTWNRPLIPMGHAAD